MDKATLPRKGAIAGFAIWILKDFKPTSLLELAVVISIVLIAGVAILTQWNLDNKEKTNEKNDNNTPIPND